MTRRLRRLAIATISTLVLGAGLAGSVGAASGPAAAATAKPLALTGYVLTGGAPSLIASEGTAFSDIGVDGCEVGRDGASISVDPAAREALRAAHAAGKPAELLVSNFDDRLSDFSPRIGARLLRGASHREAVAAALAAEVNGFGWDGITVDLEALAAADRAGLVDFLRLLRSRLPATATLDIDVPASTSTGGEAWAPFDVPAIAGIVNWVVVMAYDQHYEGGPPGPIAGLPWVRRAIAVTERQIPPSKFRLGVAGYGYLWRRGQPTRSLSDSQSRRLAGDRARWSPGGGEWHARLPGGGILWWSDRRSLNLRLRLARRAHLQGVALWRLGSSDPIGVRASLSGGRAG